MNATKNWHNTWIQITSQLRLFWVVVSLVILATVNVQAYSGWGLPYRYKSDSGGYWGNTYYFTVFPYLEYTASESCPSNHKDPNGNNYDHGHSFEAFPLVDRGEMVTAAKSDAAWDETYYAGYTRDTTSTFLSNCYALAAGAPTPMPKNGWYSFTSSDTLCSSFSGKSYAVSPDHCVYYSTQTIPGYPCILKATQEKFASSAKYSMVYTSGGSTHGGETRRRIAQP
jgi:hypothetical protein